MLSWFFCAEKFESVFSHTSTSSFRIFFHALYVFSGNVDITKERRTLYVHKESWTPVLISPTVVGVNENLNENNWVILMETSEKKKKN